MEGPTGAPTAKALSSPREQQESSGSTTTVDFQTNGALQNLLGQQERTASSTTTGLTLQKQPSPVVHIVATAATHTSSISRLIVASSEGFQPSTSSSACSTDTHKPSAAADEQDGTATFRVREAISGLGDGSGLAKCTAAGQQGSEIASDAGNKNRAAAEGNGDGSKAAWQQQQCSSSSSTYPGDLASPTASAPTEVQHQQQLHRTFSSGLPGLEGVGPSGSAAAGVGSSSAAALDLEQQQPLSSNPSPSPRPAAKEGLAGIIKEAYPGFHDLNSKDRNHVLRCGSPNKCLSYFIRYWWLVAKAHTGNMSFKAAKDLKRAIVRKIVSFAPGRDVVDVPLNQVLDMPLAEAGEATN